MSKAGADEGGAGGCGDSAQQLEAKDEKGGKLLSKLPAGSGWTKVSCPCCFSERVEPLVLVKLGGKVGPETKRWLIKVIGAPQKDGGAALLAHPGEDASGDIIVVSAPRCTLLRAAEELGLCKTYRSGDMEAFSYNDRDNFKDSDNMEVFLTLAERQYIVKYELDGLRAQRDLRIPGLPESRMLQKRDNICEVKKEMVDSVSGSKVIIDDDDSGPMISGHMLQAMFSMIWSTVFMELWKRRSSSLSYRWGTMNLAERFAEPRPNFHGDLGVNPVTGRVEPLFPEWKRDLRMVLVSVPVVGLFLGLVVLGMMCFYWGEAQVKQLHKDWNSLLSQAFLYIPSVLHIVYTNMLGNVYRNVAQSLTEYVIPFLVDRFISAPHRTESEDDPKEDKFRNQRTLPVFPGLFAEYIELLVQFGYLSLFSCVYPLTAVLLLINNITEIRSDAYKICNLFRKPFSPPVANMGVWQVAFEVLSFVSVISNCWLLLLSPRLQELCREGGLSSTNVLLLAVFGEHVLILIKFIMAALIPDEPDWIRKKRDQMEYTSMQALKEQKLQPEVS
ncbi:anoctamin-10 [Neolamprologus brichardi]|uniref:anoctamin-10 n=1 Tax=Neolamprologus brichardi TaxID=32507 RepID=UPI0003EBCED9|nr:anoctamin-10 [Neolamprologus brichardi]